MQCLRDLATIARGSAKRAHTFQAVANGLEIHNPISPKPLCSTRWVLRLVAIDACSPPIGFESWYTIYVILERSYDSA